MKHLKDNSTHNIPQLINFRNYDYDFLYQPFVPVCGENNFRSEQISFLCPTNSPSLWKSIMTHLNLYLFRFVSSVEASFANHYFTTD